MTSSIPPPPASGSGFKDPRIAATVAYFGGMITGIIILIAEKEDRYVRFHATQSTVTFLGVFVLHLVILGVPLIGWMLYMPFIVGVVGFLGMGEQDVAGPFNAVKRTMKDNKAYLTLDTTKDALKSAPGLKYDRTAMTWVADTK